MMLYGVIDIGSNTIRLAVYEVRNQNLKIMFSKKITAGLASYVNKEGYLSKKGIAKAVATLNEFKPILTNLRLEDLFVFATASLRNIRNSEEVVKYISRETDFSIDLVSGEQEGIYDFQGVSLQVSLNKGMLVDIGGGSTELVFYDDSKIICSLSIPIGSLNLYKMYVEEIIPSQNEIKKMRKAINHELDDFKTVLGYKLICGVGGTIRTASQLNNKLFGESSDYNVITYESLEKIILGFSENKKESIRKILKISPERIHTILPGLLILREIVIKYGCDSISVAAYGAREGYLYTKLSEGGIKNA